jgi:hypothetical protein
MDAQTGDKVLQSLRWKEMTDAQKADLPAMLAEAAKLRTTFDSGGVMSMDECADLTKDQVAGFAAAQRGKDHLPGIPLYGRLDQSAGYVFGQNRVIGFLEISQTRRKVETCASASKSVYSPCLAGDTKAGEQTTALPVHAPFVEGLEDIVFDESRTEMDYQGNNITK